MGGQTHPVFNGRTMSEQIETSKGGVGGLLM